MKVLLGKILQKRPEPREITTFGKEVTGHMAIAKYRDGAWTDVYIQKRMGMFLPQNAQVLDYGHSLFEGAKAFRHPNGDFYTFRFRENAKRMNDSARFLRMPTIPEEVQLEAVHRLITIDKDFYPANDDASFYIRPKLMGITPQTGISAGNEFMYTIILSPSGPYYSNPVSALVANSIKRVPSGGQGKAKIAANYANNPRNVEIASKFGAQQLLYTDPYNVFIEEYGSMNHFHITKDDKMIIPEFTDNILPSITARSVAELAETLGLRVKHKSVPLEELRHGIRNGYITEAGGLGTAAVISPVEHYVKISDDVTSSDFEKLLDGKELNIAQDHFTLRGQPRPWINKLFESYTNIQRGIEPDKFGWLEKVHHKYYRS